YLPMKPNGDPMFRGSQFNSRINGGQTMATENFFDGAAFGYASGHQQSHESTPPLDAIQEMKVITTTYSAQYGHTSGGFIEYTSKSGTNNIHGTAYEYFANDALNARGFFDADCTATGCTPRNKTPLKNNGFGFTAGGPVVIPRVYNGAGNPAGDQTWLLNARNIEFRVDHNFTPNFRMTETFYWNHRPSVRNCGEVAGCTVSHDGQTSPQLNTDYYGNGFYQRIVT